MNAKTTAQINNEINMDRAIRRYNYLTNMEGIDRTNAAITAAYENNLTMGQVLNATN